MSNILPRREEDIWQGDISEAEVNLLSCTSARWRFADDVSCRNITHQILFSRDECKTIGSTCMKIQAWTNELRRLIS